MIRAQFVYSNLGLVLSNFISLRKIMLCVRMNMDYNNNRVNIQKRKLILIEVTKWQRILT